MTVDPDSDKSRSAWVLLGARQVGSIAITAGVLTALAGVVAIVWPNETLLVLAIAAGVALLCAGILGIIHTLVDEDSGSRVLDAIVGILAFLAGILVIRRPDQTLLVIVMAVGILLSLSGVVTLARTLTGRVPSRGLGYLSAAVDLVLGIVILSWPKESLATLAVLAGIAFVLRGLLMVLGGLALRRSAPEAA